MKKKKKFRPLQQQIAILFTFFLVFSILTIIIINEVFLEKYYVSKKMEVLLEAKATLEEMDLENLMGSSELFSDNRNPNSQSDNILKLPDEIERASSRNNLSWVVINEDNSKSCSWGENEKMLCGKLFGYIYDLDSDKNNSKILKTTSDCLLQQVYDRFAGMYYVECWGTFGEDYYFLIRTPLESIKESVAISNTFYCFVGLTMIVISCFVLTIVSKKITKPISELTNLSQKMAQQDFNAKYKSNVGNEIDVLGNSFNKMAEKLEKTISELKYANNILQKDIENKIEEEKKQKEFLDNVSHELKTPIALIQGYAEGLKDNIAEDPESMEFYCDVIIDEAAKMNKLVKNLLSLNQLESRNDALTMECFNIVDVIGGVLQKMDIVIKQKNIQVIFQEKDPRYVWADEFRIEEVVTNYISNAINHIDGKRNIIIKVLPEDEVYRISVFNTGVPIPEKDLPMIWSKFYKVDKARTREYGGSGIGLSIVKAIICGLNQKYGVENYEDGVEFWFTLDKK